MKNKSGVYHFLSFGEPIPEGAEPLSSLIPDGVYQEMLVRGFFAIGEPSIAILAKGEFSAPEHDLGHWLVFLKRPKVMGLMKRAAKRILALIPKGKAEDSFPREGFPARLRDRFFYASEMMTFIEPEVRRHVENLPLVKKAFAATRWQKFSRRLLGETPVGVAQENLEMLTNEELVELTRDLMALFAAYAYPIGGVAADIVTRYSGDRVMVGSVWQMSRDVVYVQANERWTRLMVARLYVAMLEVSAITPEEWFAGMLDQKLDKRSKLYKTVCRSGLWYGTWIYDAYCL